MVKVILDINTLIIQAFQWTTVQTGSQLHHLKDYLVDIESYSSSKHAIKTIPNMPIMQSKRGL
jgi:hypothetical protein